MKRRSFSLGLVGALACGAVRAGMPNVPIPPTKDGLPYTVVTPPYAEDATVFRLFFAYTCNFCRASHSMLSRWGASIPNEVTFRETPVVGDNDSLVAAVAFYAMRTVAPARMIPYHEHIYEKIHEARVPIKDPKLYAEAAFRAGADVKAFLRATASENVRRTVSAAVALPAQYRLTSTPSLTFAGRYVINPEVTQGVNESFITLANAVASKAIYEMRG